MTKPRAEESKCCIDRMSERERQWLSFLGLRMKWGYRQLGEWRSIAYSTLHQQPCRAVHALQNEMMRKLDFLSGGSSVSGVLTRAAGCS
jgi:hypothetical protein